MRTYVMTKLIVLCMLMYVYGELVEVVVLPMYSILYVQMFPYIVSAMADQHDH
jgi:hypothetical protein